MLYKIVDNFEDPELRDEAEKQLKQMKEKYGKRYCPCALVHNPDYVCPCKDFRDMDEEGECYCGRYRKIKIEGEKDEDN